MLADYWGRPITERERMETFAADMRSYGDATDDEVVAALERQFPEELKRAERRALDAGRPPA